MTVNLLAIPVLIITTLVDVLRRMDETEERMLQARVRAEHLHVMGR